MNSSALSIGGETRSGKLPPRPLSPEEALGPESMQHCGGEDSYDLISLLGPFGNQRVDSVHKGGAGRCPSASTPLTAIPRLSIIRA